MGRVIVFDGDFITDTLSVDTEKSGKKIVLHVKVNPPEMPNGSHRMSMGSSEGILVKDEVEESPYPKMQKMMLETAWKIEFLTLLEIVLGSDTKPSTRLMGANEIEEDIAHAGLAVWKKVEEHFLSFEPPEGVMCTRDSPLIGHGKILLDKLVVKYGHRPAEQTI